MCGDGVMDRYPWVLSFAHEQRRPRGLRSAMIVWRGVAREDLQEFKCLQRCSLSMRALMRR